MFSPHECIGSSHTTTSTITTLFVYTIPQPNPTTTTLMAMVMVTAMFGLLAMPHVTDGDTD